MVGAGLEISGGVAVVREDGNSQEAASCLKVMVAYVVGKRIGTRSQLALLLPRHEFGFLPSSNGFPPAKPTNPRRRRPSVIDHG